MHGVIRSVISAFTSSTYHRRAWRSSSAPATRTKRDLNRFEFDVGSARSVHCALSNYAIFLLDAGQRRCVRSRRIDAFARARRANRERTFTTCDRFECTFRAERASATVNISADCRGEAGKPAADSRERWTLTCTSFALCFRSVVPPRKIIATTRGILWTALRVAARQTAFRCARNNSNFRRRKSRRLPATLYESREAKRAEVPRHDRDLSIVAVEERPGATIIKEHVIRFCSSPLAITTTISRVFQSRGFQLSRVHAR